MGKPKKEGTAAEKPKKQQAKKEEKTKKSLKGSTPAPVAKKDKAIESDRAVDAVYFLTQLAIEHGLPPREYTRNRSLKEWQRTMLALAGKIFEKGSSSSSNSVGVGAGSEATVEEEAQ